MIDRPAAHIVLSIVAGQLEVGFFFGHISQPSAANMSVVLHGHHRKVTKGSVGVSGVAIAKRIFVADNYSPKNSNWLLTDAGWAS